VDGCLGCRQSLFLGLPNHRPHEKALGGIKQEIILGHSGSF
jgi:hypothetical protein